MADTVANEIDANCRDTTNQCGPQRYHQKIRRVGKASDEAARRHLTRPGFHRARDWRSRSEKATEFLRWNLLGQKTKLAASSKRRWRGLPHLDR